MAGNTLTDNELTESILESSPGHPLAQVNFATSNIQRWPLSHLAKAPTTPEQGSTSSLSSLPPSSAPETPAHAKPSGNPQCTILDDDDTVLPSFDHTRMPRTTRKWANRIYQPPPDTPTHLHGTHFIEGVLTTSDLDIPQTSPVRGATAGERRAHIRRKEAKYKQRETEKQEAEEQKRQVAVFDHVLKLLEDEEVAFGSLLYYVSDSLNYQGKARYTGLFQIRGRVSKILDLWMSASHKSREAREEISDWAVRHVAKLVYHEGHRATVDGFLRTSKMVIGMDFASGFSMRSQREKLEVLCPTMTTLLNTFVTSNRQNRQMTERRREHKRTVSRLWMYSK